MKYSTTQRIASAVVTGSLFACSLGWAADVYLRAEALTKDLPGKPGVLMWGFALDTDQDFNTTLGEPATVPGPRIDVPDTDTTLVIHLKNNLAVPVSIVIPNQNGYVRAVAEPVKFTPPGDTRERARSFAKETAPGGENLYQWNNVTPGTYLYYSGSHSSLQVQMGLYGAVVRKASPTDAYPGISAGAEQLVLFSEIDTRVHDAVAANDYGPGLGMSSTIHSVPDYFLINGQPYTAGQAPLAAGTEGQNVLIRMLNASVNSRIPVVYGLDQKAIAEDGRPYPYPRILTAPELPALKTMDVMVSPDVAGTYTLYDRALGLMNGTDSAGGMLTYLQVAP